MWFDLENHDTRVLIQTIRGEEEPLKWFASDWPLYNGFYRPLPAVSFELDDRLYGNNLRLYCLTNWSIAFLCSFLVVWLVYELFRKTGPALGAGILFASWQTGMADFVPIEWIGGILAAAILSASLFRSQFKFGLVAAALILLAAREVSGWLDLVDVVAMDFPYRTIGWPVGRTATMLTMFALPCVAAYCRWERTRKWQWAAVSILCLVLGMMCYEQVVVVTALLLGSAIAISVQGVKVRWSWHLLMFGMLGAYWYLHSTFLPRTRYQDQAFRGTGGAIRDMMSWLFPAAFEMKFLPVFLTPDIGPYAVLITRFWLYLAQTASCFISYLSFKRHWLPITYGILASAGAYLPMAFQHPLVHYHHMPMAFRTPFVVWLVILTADKIRAALRIDQATS